LQSPKSVQSPDDAEACHSRLGTCLSLAKLHSHLQAIAQHRQLLVFLNATSAFHIRPVCLFHAYAFLYRFCHSIFLQPKGGLQGKTRASPSLMHEPHKLADVAFKCFLQSKGLQGLPCIQMLDLSHCRCVILCHLYVLRVFCVCECVFVCVFVCVHIVCTIWKAYNLDGCWDSSCSRCCTCAHALGCVCVCGGDVCCVKWHIAYTLIVWPCLLHNQLYMHSLQKQCLPITAASQPIV